jgi:hypothetical protein
VWKEWDKSSWTDCPLFRSYLVKILYTWLKVFVVFLFPSKLGLPWYFSSNRDTFRQWCDKRAQYIPGGLEKGVRDYHSRGRQFFKIMPILKLFLIIYLLKHSLKELYLNVLQRKNEHIHKVIKYNLL